MKKLIFMAGCVALLSLSMMFAGCSKDKKDENNGGGITTSGQYTVGETSYNITKAIYRLNAVYNETTIGFLSKGTVENPINSISVNFDNQNAILVGTFNLDNDNIDGGVIINGNEYYDIEAGTLTIAKSGNSYTVTITNGTIEDNRNLTLNFTGTIEKLEIPEPPIPTDSYFTLGENTYDIVLGAYGTTEENLTAIVLMDSYNENANTLNLVFEGNQIQTGTFEFSLYSTSFMGVLQIGETTYMLTSGTAQISKSGDTYTIDITNGSAISMLNPMGNGTAVTCHFSGKLLTSPDASL